MSLRRPAAVESAPPYVEFARSGEIARRAAEAHELLGERCVVCPRGCKVDRRADVKGLCAIGRYAVVASYFPHFGEEDCLRGRRGSGTIFFSGCNLRCVFCQNHDISWEVRGEHVTAERLATMMLELQAIGCHNINWVTPEHVVPQILEALPLAVDGGLGLPIVYNTSAYDSLDSLRLMDGIVDVYMPDFKLWTHEAARRYLKRPDYAEVARETIKEMHRQVGDLVLGADGMARRGLIVRHLVMPGGLGETEAILRWIRETLGPDVYVNLMDQYSPAGKVGPAQFADINRRLRPAEFLEAQRIAADLRMEVRRRLTTAGLDPATEQEVVEELTPRLSARMRTRLATPGTRNSEAFEAYARGRAHVLNPTRADLTRAKELFENALKLDPNYAPAYAYLGMANVEVGNYKEAINAYERAYRIRLGLDPFWGHGNHA